MKGDKYALAVIGHGGVTGYGEPPQTWRVTGISDKEAEDGAAIVVDLTPIPWDDLCTLSISGPMVDPKLEGNARQGIFGDIEPFDPNPVDGRDPRLGNARSFDHVSVKVYCELARSFGAMVYRGRQKASAA